MLSEIKGERAMEALSRLVDPIAAIAEDREAAEIFIRKKAPEDIDKTKYVTDRIRKAVPKLMEKHRDEFAEIMAIIKDVEREFYIENVSLPELIIDISSLISDDLFCSFFTFAPKDRT